MNQRRFLRVLGDLPRTAWLAGLVIALLVVFMSGGILTPTTADAQQPTPTPTPSTIMRVDPTAQSVPAGTNVVIDIRVDDVTSLAAYEFEIQYEATVLSFVSATNGSFLGSTGRTVTCLPVWAF